jgi:hypothetical protein
MESSRSNRILGRLWGKKSYQMKSNDISRGWNEMECYSENNVKIPLYNYAVEVNPLLTHVMY